MREACLLQSIRPAIQLVSQSVSQSVGQPACQLLGLVIQSLVLEARKLEGARILYSRRRSSDLTGLRGPKKYALSTVRHSQTTVVVVLL